MKLKVLALTFSMFALAACDKVSTITGSGTKCDSDITKQIVVETFSKNVSDIASTRVKELGCVDTFSLKK